MTAEDRITARFTASRIKAQKVHIIFNTVTNIIDNYYVLLFVFKENEV